MEKGCFDLIKKLQAKKELNISTLYIDVFGFSRGAAAARIFVNELYKTKNFNNPKSYAMGNLGKAFKELNYKKLPIRIKIRFLGLYDTVSSYGSDVIDDINNDKVALTIPRVGFTVHLTAEDEHRKNFPLTNIASAGSNSKELILPGVHSDIGGGYNNGEVEDVILTETRSTIETEMHRALEHGWYTSSQLYRYARYLQGIRPNLSNQYSLVILHLMAEFGKRKYNIPWDYKKILDKKYQIPEALESVKKRINSYAFENQSKIVFYTKEQLLNKKEKLGNDSSKIEKFNRQVNDHNMLMWLRNQYLHNSASMDGIGMEPRKKKNMISIEWKRYVING